MTGCRTSDREDCCGTRDGCDVAGVGGRVKTGGWSLDTVACPGPVGLVW